MSSKKYLPGPESYREFRETGPRALRQLLINWQILRLMGDLQEANVT